MEFKQYTPFANKVLNEDGSISELYAKGAQLAPPDEERAKEYSARSPMANKMLNEDGSITEIATGGGGGGVTSVDGQTGDVILDYTKLVRAQTTPTPSIEIGTTPTDIVDFPTTNAGNYRFFVSGQVARTGGSSGAGTLRIELLDGSDALITGGDFEIFRDLNTVKQLMTSKTFDIGAGETLKVKASYTPASTETISVSDVVVGFDCIVE